MASVRSNRAVSTSAAERWDLRSRLSAVHGLMRQELAELARELARFEASNASADEAKEWTAYLWREGAKFCAFVEDHHSIEDSVILPAVRRTQPGRGSPIAGVLTKIQADHRELQERLSEFKETLAALPGDALARSAACEALQRLSSCLIAHLQFEEEGLAESLSRL